MQENLLELGVRKSKRLDSRCQWELLGNQTLDMWYVCTYARTYVCMHTASQKVGHIVLI